MFLEKILSKETYEKLVKQCGEELTAQLAERTKDFDIDIANEKLIPKAVLDTERQTVKDLRAEIATRDAQLTELGSRVKDGESLNGEIEKLKELNKTSAEEYESKLKKQAYEYKLESALSSSKAKNIKAVRALMDESKFELKDDVLNGFEEQIKSLRDSDPYLFEPEVSGGTGGAPNGVADSVIKTGFDFTSIIPDVIK